MLIYLSFLQSKVNHAIPAYSFWEYYIKNGLIEAGFSYVETTDIDWAEGLLYTNDDVKLSFWKTITWEKALKHIKHEQSKRPIHLFLSYLYPHQIDKTAINEIKKLGIPCINFFCDNVRQFTQIPNEFDVFDLNWVPEFKALEMYKKANYPHLHLPMPMWVSPENRSLSKVERTNISFIGSKDIQRLLFFESLVKKGIEIDIYGAGWLNTRVEIKEDETSFVSFTSKVKNQVAFLKDLGLQAYLRKLKQLSLKENTSDLLSSFLKGKPTFEEYIKITKECMITLGINRYPSYLHPLDKPNTYSRLRDIEAPMLGACYLTEYTEGIEHMYDLNNEIYVYYSITDLLSKIEFLKKEPKIRLALRVNGQTKALNELSIRSTLYKLRDTFYE